MLFECKNNNFKIARGEHKTTKKQKTFLYFFEPKETAYSNKELDFEEYTENKNSGSNEQYKYLYFIYYLHIIEKIKKIDLGYTGTNAVEKQAIKDYIDDIKSDDSYLLQDDYKKIIPKKVTNLFKTDDKNTEEYLLECLHSIKAYGQYFYIINHYLDEELTSPDFDADLYDGISETMRRCNKELREKINECNNKKSSIEKIDQCNIFKKDPNYIIKFNEIFEKFKDFKIYDHESFNSYGNTYHYYELTFENFKKMVVDAETKIKEIEKFIKNRMMEYILDNIFTDLMSEQEKTTKKLNIKGLIENLNMKEKKEKIIQNIKKFIKIDKIESESVLEQIIYIIKGIEIMDVIKDEEEIIKDYVNRKERKFGAVLWRIIECIKNLKKSINFSKETYNYYEIANKEENIKKDNEYSIKNESNLTKIDKPRKKLSTYMCNKLSDFKDKLREKFSLDMYTKSLKYRDVHWSEYSKKFVYDNKKINEKIDNILEENLFLVIDNYKDLIKDKENFYADYIEKNELEYIFDEYIYYFDLIKKYAQYFYIIYEKKPKLGDNIFELINMYSDGIITFEKNFKNIYNIFNEIFSLKNLKLYIYEAERTIEDFESFMEQEKIKKFICEKIENFCKQCKIHEEIRKKFNEQSKIYKEIVENLEMFIFYTFEFKNKIKEYIKEIKKIYGYDKINKKFENEELDEQIKYREIDKYYNEMPVYFKFTNNIITKNAFNEYIVKIKQKFYENYNNENIPIDDLIKNNPCLIKDDYEIFENKEKYPKQISNIKFYGRLISENIINNMKKLKALGQFFHIILEDKPKIDNNLYNSIQTILNNKKNDMYSFDELKDFEKSDNSKDDLNIKNIYSSSYLKTYINELKYTLIEYKKIIKRKFHDKLFEEYDKTDIAIRRKIPPNGDPKTCLQTYIEDIEKHLGAAMLRMYCCIEEIENYYIEKIKNYCDNYKESSNDVADLVKPFKEYLEKTLEEINNIKNDMNNNEDESKIVDNKKENINNKESSNDVSNPINVSKTELEKINSIKNDMNNNEDKSKIINNKKENINDRKNCIDATNLLNKLNEVKINLEKLGQKIENTKNKKSEEENYDFKDQLSKETLKKFKESTEKQMIEKFKKYKGENWQKYLKPFETYEKEIKEKINNIIKNNPYLIIDDYKKLIPDNQFFENDEYKDLMDDYILFYFENIIKYAKYFHIIVEYKPEPGDNILYLEEKIAENSKGLLTFKENYDEINDNFFNNIFSFENLKIYINESKEIISEFENFIKNNKIDEFISEKTKNSKDLSNTIKTKLEILIFYITKVKNKIEDYIEEIKKIYGYDEKSKKFKNEEESYKKIKYVENENYRDSTTFDLKFINNKATSEMFNDYIKEIKDKFYKNYNENIPIDDIIKNNPCLIKDDYETILNKKISPENLSSSYYDEHTKSIMTEKINQIKAYGQFFYIILKNNLKIDENLSNLVKSISSQKNNITDFDELKNEDNDFNIEKIRINNLTKLEEFIKTTKEAINNEENFIKTGFNKYANINLNEDIEYLREKHMMDNPHTPLLIYIRKTEKYLGASMLRMYYCIKEVKNYIEEIENKYIKNEDKDNENKILDKKYDDKNSNEIKSNLYTNIDDNIVTVKSTSKEHFYNLENNDVVIEKDKELLKKSIKFYQTKMKKNNNTVPKQINITIYQPSIDYEDDKEIWKYFRIYKWNEKSTNSNLKYEFLEENQDNIYESDFKTLTNNKDVIFYINKQNVDDSNNKYNENKIIDKKYNDKNSNEKKSNLYTNIDENIVTIESTSKEHFYNLENNDVVIKKDKELLKNSIEFYQTKMKKNSNTAPKQINIIIYQPSIDYDKSNLESRKICKYVKTYKWNEKNTNSDLKYELVSEKKYNIYETKDNVLANTGQIIFYINKQNVDDVVVEFESTSSDYYYNLESYQEIIDKDKNILENCIKFYQLNYKTENVPKQINIITYEPAHYPEDKNRREIGKYLRGYTWNENDINTNLKYRFSKYKFDYIPEKKIKMPSKPINFSIYKNKNENNNK